MAVRERTTLCILTGDAHRHAIEYEGAEGQRFGMPPLDAALLAHRLATALELFGETRVDREVRRPLQQRFVDEVQTLRPHAGDDRRRGRLDGVGGPRRMLLATQQRLLEARVNVGVALRHQPLHLRRVAGAHHSFAHETAGPHLRHRGVLADGRRARGLCVHRLVTLVVPVTAIAHEIDEDVLLERRAVGARKPHRDHAPFRIVGVHVEDRDLETLREV